MKISYGRQMRNTRVTGNSKLYGMLQSAAYCFLLKSVSAPHKQFAMSCR